MSRINRQYVVAASLVAACAAMPQRAAAQQGVATPTPATPATTRPSTGQPAPLPAQGQSTPAPPSARKSGTPQGFSVVLVLGELQGAGAADDVPLAAKRALADMRDFLPYKSYRLLDAAWLMCCGEAPRPMASSERRSTNAIAGRGTSTLALRGPDDQEYELHLTTSRSEGGRVFVQFNLLGTNSPDADTVNLRANQRRLADLEDKSEMLQKQIADAKKRVEVGVASPTAELPKMELELRSTQRSIVELRERVANARGGGARSSSERQIRTAVIDTSFTMDVGETVVVGASRPKGATKALIALVTSVPRGGSGAAR